MLRPNADVLQPADVLTHCLAAMAANVRRHHIGEVVGPSQMQWLDVLDLPALSAFSEYLALADVAEAASGIEDADLLGTGETAAVHLSSSGRRFIGLRPRPLAGVRAGTPRRRTMS